jgi:hypothetical protein
MLFLFLSAILISIRWRGSFNGGSDFMSLIVLSALSFASAFPDSAKAQAACFWYIAIQTCTSYFLAGTIKLRNPDWRSGRALRRFVKTSIYAESPLSSWISRTLWLSLLASWSVMLFECLFPISLFFPKVCVAMLCLGFLFHLANVYFFGLNRFLLSWSAAYPAVLFCSRIKVGL